jgi:sugar phosphate isomerase/epimerase
MAERLGLSMLNLPQRYPEGWVDDMHTAGLETVEISRSNQSDNADIARITCQAYQNAGFAINSVHLPFRELWDISSPNEDIRRAALDKLMPFFPVLKQYRARYAVLHPSFEPIPAPSRALRKEAFRRSLRELCDAAEAADCIVAVEDLPRTCLCNTAQETLELLSDEPRSVICFDTNHLLQESAVDFARACAGRIRTLHISDYDGIDERHWLPGEGIIDFHEVFRILREAGYAGSYIMELGTHRDGSAYTPQEAADALRAALGQRAT